MGSISLRNRVKFDKEEKQLQEKIRRDKDKVLRNMEESIKRRKALSK